MFLKHLLIFSITHWDRYSTFPGILTFVLIWRHYHPNTRTFQRATFRSLKQQLLNSCYTCLLKICILLTTWSPLLLFSPPPAKPSRKINVQKGRPIGSNKAQHKSCLYRHQVSNIIQTKVISPKTILYGHINYTKSAQCFLIKRISLQSFKDIVEY